MKFQTLILALWNPMFLIFMVSSSSSSSSNELEMFCPEQNEFIQNLCTCPYNHDKNSPNQDNGQEILSKCSPKIQEVSHEIFSTLKKITKDWEVDSFCDQPEEAFKQSTVLPDYTSLISHFMHKLKNCQSQDTISIVVLGGSVTLGKNCYGGNIPPPDTDFLGIPEKPGLPFSKGDSKCPWSNRLYTLLTKQYPQCGTIDIYNLAKSGSNTNFALTYVNTYLTAAGGSREGKTLGEVVDLVLLDYGVNDGTIQEKPIMNKLKEEPSSEYKYVQSVEAVNEYLISFLLKRVRNRPALMLVGNSGPGGDTNGLIPHLDAAKRYGVPLASARHAISYPDNPCWLSFTSPPGTLYENRAKNPLNGETSKLERWSNNGYFYDHDVEQVPHSEFNGAWTKMPVKEGPFLFVAEKAVKKDEEEEAKVVRMHNFLQCWGKDTHPPHDAHALVAQVVFYNLHVMAESTKLTLATCVAKNEVVQIASAPLSPPPSSHLRQEKVTTSSYASTKKQLWHELQQVDSHSNSNNQQQLATTSFWKIGQPSNFAEAQASVLNHMIFCAPTGPLSEYSSESLFLNGKFDLNEFGDNNQSDWRLVQDRPHKYGFIIEKSPSLIALSNGLKMSEEENDARSTLRFKIHISKNTRLSIEYLYSYENAGQIEVSIMDLSKGGRQTEQAKIYVQYPSPLVPGSTMLIDSYNPRAHNALYTEVALTAKGYSASSNAVLVIKLVKPTSKLQLESRGGNRFKLVGVKTC